MFMFMWKISEQNVTLYLTTVSYSLDLRYILYMM